MSKGTARAGTSSNHHLRAIEYAFALKAEHFGVSGVRLPARHRDGANQVSPQSFADRRRPASPGNAEAVQWRRNAQAGPHRSGDPWVYC